MDDVSRAKVPDDVFFMIQSSHLLIVVPSQALSEISRLPASGEPNGDYATLILTSTVFNALHRKGALSPLVARKSGQNFPTGCKYTS